MANLMDIISLVIITVSIPTIFLVGMKVFKNNQYSKMMKIVSLVLFFAEVVRFFVVAHHFELGKVPSDELKIGFVTFVSILALFAAFISNKYGSIFKKLFVIVSLLPLVVGIFQGRVYTLESDKYAIVKGLYFLESGLSVLLALLFINNEKLEFNWIDLLIGCCVVLAFLGVSALLINIWSLSIEFNLIYFLEKAAMLIVTAVTFLVAKEAVYK